MAAEAGLETLELVTLALLLCLRPAAKSKPFFSPGTSLRAGFVTIPFLFGLLLLSKQQAKTFSERRITTDQNNKIKEKSQGQE